MTDGDAGYTNGSLRERLAVVGRMVDELLQNRREDREKIDSIAEIIGRIDERLKAVEGNHVVVAKRVDRIERAGETKSAAAWGAGGVAGAAGGLLAALIRGLITGDGG